MDTPKDDKRKKTKAPPKNTAPKNNSQNSKDDVSVLKTRINSLAVDVGNLKKQNTKLNSLVELLQSQKFDKMTHKIVPKISEEVIAAIKQNCLVNQDCTPVVRIPTHDASACAVTGDSQTTNQQCDTDAEFNFMCYTTKSVANPQASTVGFDVVVNSGTVAGTKLIVPLANLKPGLPLVTQAYTSDGAYAVVPRSFSTLKGAGGNQSYIAYPVTLSNPLAAHWHVRLIGASSGTDKVVIIYSDGTQSFLSGEVADLAVPAAFTDFTVYLDEGSASESFQNCRLQFEVEVGGASPMTLLGSQYCQVMKISKLVHSSYFQGDDTTSVRVAEIAHMFTFYGSTLDNAGSFNAATLNTPLNLVSTIPSYSYATALSTCNRSVQSSPVRLGLYQPSFPAYPEYTAGVDIVDPFSDIHSQYGVLWTFANILRVSGGDGPQPLALKLHAVVEYKSKQPIGAVSTTFGLSSEFEMARKVLLNNYTIPHNPDHLTSAFNRIKSTIADASSSVFHFVQDGASSLIKNLSDPKKMEQFSKAAKVATTVGELGLEFMIDAL